MSTSTIGLSPELFAAIFPFHIAFNRDRQIVQLGAALQRICPTITVYQPIEQHLAITRPAITLDFDAIQQQTHALFLLEVLANRMQLKGQMVYAVESDVLLFIGSPWITDTADLAPLGLKLTDFAIHDPIADYLFLLQAQKTALADTRTLASKLTQQQAEIQRALEKEQELREMKTRFITNTSHEFRTPLGIISSSAGILQDYGSRGSTELSAKHLQRIQSAVQQITALLEDVLLMNRLE